MCAMQSVPFFGAAASSSEFQPQDLSVNSPYYRGPVERRAIPTGILVALSLLLLIIFVLWCAVGRSPACSRAPRESHP